MHSKQCSLCQFSCIAAQGLLSVPGNERCSLVAIAAMAAMTKNLSLAQIRHADIVRRRLRPRLRGHFLFAVWQFATYTVPSGFVKFPTGGLFWPLQMIPFIEMP